MNWKFWQKGNEYREKAVGYQQTLIDYPDDYDNSVTNCDYSYASKEGFLKNFVVFRAITDIAEGASSIPLVIEDKETEALLKRPFMNTSYKSWMSDAIKYKCLGGNMFAEASIVGKNIRSLRLIRNDRITIDIGSNSQGLSDQLLGYRWEQGISKYFPVDQETMMSEMFQSKFFNPECDHDGLSLLSAAMISIEQSNAMAKYNKSVVENNGMPSSLLVMKEPKDKMTPAPSEDQMTKLREQMDKKLGKDRKNSFAVVNWMYDAVRLGMSQQEMDWVNSKETTAREIALAIGYPPFLLGFANGSTFNNVEEAKMSLYENTIIPILKGVLDDLSIYIGSITGKDIDIDIDRDSILALQPRVISKREAARADFQAGLIGDTEAREEGNYPEEVEGERFIASNMIPLGMDLTLLEGGDG